MLTAIGRQDENGAGRLPWNCAEQGIAVFGMDLKGLIAARDRGARKADRLEQIAVRSNPADVRKVGPSMPPVSPTDGRSGTRPRSQERGAAARWIAADGDGFEFRHPRVFGDVLIHDFGDHGDGVFASGRREAPKHGLQRLLHHTPAARRVLELRQQPGGNFRIVRPAPKRAEQLLQLHRAGRRHHVGQSQQLGAAELRVGQHRGGLESRVGRPTAYERPEQHIE